LGGSLLVLDLFLWNQSVLFVGAGLSTVLSNLEVVFLIIIGKIFFAEKVPNHFSMLFIFILLGVSCLLTPIYSKLDAANFFGSLLALSASLTYALYLFSIKYLAKRFPQHAPTTLLAVICLTGCLLLGGILCFGKKEMLTFPSLNSAVYVIINGVLSQILAWWLISKGIRDLSLSLSGFLLLLQPALTFTLDCLFLARNTHWLQLIGALCLLGSVYLASQNQQSLKETHEPSH
jgi:drug/metabolite transporter (DMT)-like permease